MFKELRKQIRLSEEAEVSASTGQEVDLDELNEDEEEVVDTEDKTLEEIVSLFEDEVLTMDAEDAERLMTEDDDEEETLEEDDKDRNINRGSRLAVKAAKFINKKEKSSKVKSVKHNVREATTDEVERLSKKRKITTYLMFGLGAKFVEKNYNTNDKATVISVEVEYENGKKDIVVFAGLTNSKPSEVKNKLESTLKDLKAGKQIKEDEDVEGTEDGARLDTLEEAYNFLFEEDSEEETLEEDDKDRNINRGSRLAVKAAKFINKKEKSSKVKSVKHNVREATTDEVERLSKKRKITTYLMFGLGAKFVEKNYNTNDKATVISVEVEYENGKKDIVVFAGLTNSKPSEVKNKLESTLKDLKAGKQIKEDEDVEGTEDGARLDTLEEAYNFLFEEDSEEDSEEDLDKELEEMISFLEGDDEEADEVEEKEEEAKEKLAEALNALRALRKAKRNRR